MTDPRNDRDPRLHELLHDAVSDVEPREALHEIRNRTKVTPMTSRRPWVYGVAGAAVATAATIAAVALVGGDLGQDSSDDPGPATPPSGEVSQSPSVDASGTPEPDGTDDPTAPSDIQTEQTVPVYYAGDGPQGVRLFREFHSVKVGGGMTELTAALTDAVMRKPHDPDYRTGWPEGTRIDHDGTSATDDLITLSLVPGSDELRERPAGMSEEEARIAVEQLIYTAQAAIGKGRLPVQFLLEGEHTDMLLGVPSAEPLANAPVPQTLSLMSITSPDEGQAVKDTFTATGVNNGFEAWVGWQVLDGDEVVAEDFGTAEGWGPNKLFPWKVNVDVSDLPPGEYVLRLYNDDPSGGMEGNGPAEDTRTIVVR